MPSIEMASGLGVLGTRTTSERTVVQNRNYCYSQVLTVHRNIHEFGQFSAVFVCDSR